MSPPPQPPTLPDEEEENWAPAQQAAPVRLQSAASPFRFSLTRLIIATALAPLPLLLIRPGAEGYAGWFLFSCLALFAAMLMIRARDLPRLNVTLTIVVLSLVLLSSSPDWPFIPFIFGLPAMLVARWLYPPVATGCDCKLGCDQVIYSSLLLYVCMNLVSLFLFQDSWLGGAVVGGTILLLVVNLCWVATIPHATLDQRPGLGFLYESTMVLIPLAMLIAYGEIVRGYSD